MSNKLEEAIAESLANTTLLIIIYSFLVFVPGALEFLDRSNPVAMIIGMILGGVIFVVGQCVFWRFTEKRKNSKQF